MSVAGRLVAAGAALLGIPVVLYGLMFVAWFMFEATTTMTPSSWDGRHACVGTFEEAARSGGLAVAGAGVEAGLLLALFVLGRIAFTGRLGNLRRLALAPPLAAAAVAAGLIVVLLFQLDNPPAPLC